MIQSEIKKHFIRCKVDGCEHKFTSVIGIVHHVRYAHQCKLVVCGQYSYVEKFNYLRLPWKWLSNNWKKLILLIKNKWSCQKCGFNKRRDDGGIILEMDHIDANHHNNSKENLRILCPNCHAMTDNFRNWGNKQNRIRSTRNTGKLIRHRKGPKKRFNVSKRTLTDLIWKKGLTGTAILFGVSHTSIARRAKKLGIITPGARTNLEYRKKKYKEIFGKELFNDDGP